MNHHRPFHNHPLFSLLIIFFLFSLLIGCAVEKGKVYEKDGKLYGKPAGLFKSQWNDYYQRGVSYSEGEFWEDAATDFSKALQKRKDDQRRARTYGMHFIDYFPNRELGIAYFQLGKYQQAIQALEASLKTVESARAKFYLNKARSAWLNETRLDIRPPAITVTYPPAGYRTNGISISVNGTARDDFFISKISFNGKPTQLELSRQEVAFTEEFPLQEGKNVITLQSEDILGKTSAPITLEVNADREGPLVFLEVAPGSGAVVKVTGAAYDTSGITKIILNGREISFDEQQMVMLEELCGSQAASAASPVYFEAVDSVGNKTKGYLASLPGTPRAPAMDIRGFRDGQATFLATFKLEGTVRAGKGIKDFTVKRRSLLPDESEEAAIAFRKLLRERKGRLLAFSAAVQLEEGENIITAGLADGSGKAAARTATIRRIIPTVRQIGSRLSVAIFPFTELKESEESLRNYVDTFLNYSFIDQKRFNVLKRDTLQSVFAKHDGGRDQNFDEVKAVRIGGAMGTDTVLLGEITSHSDSIEILARLIDTKNSSTLAEKDVYWEGEMTAGFRGILDELALKFKEQFPLREGTVTQTASDTAVIDLGRDQSICPEMKFLSFLENRPLSDPETGMDLGSDTEIVGLLSAREVAQNTSRVAILETFTLREIQAGDRVISK
jgi:tetratricopeptide (TPR) repeat protein/TolB-like protein